MNTAKIRISQFIAGDAEGSDISTPGSGSGYSEQLAVELDRLGWKGGMANLTAESLRDLAEFGEAMICGHADNGNTSGVRAWRNFIEKCRNQATMLDQLEAT